MIFANNNIAATNAGTTAFYCDFSGISNPLNFYNNNVFSKQGAAYGGACTDQTGSNRNISANPEFVSSGNLRLKGGSPAIDAGSNTAQICQSPIYPATRESSMATAVQPQSWIWARTSFSLPLSLRRA
jgi:hypothetical protein